MNRVALAVCAALLCAAPGSAGSFKFYEGSVGPGLTASFPTGNGLVADIDFDADTAEAGALHFGASEIEIRPTGSVVFVAFVCQLAECTENDDYVFTPGSADAGGKVIVSDPDLGSKSGLFELGDLQFDVADAGTIELVGCNYTGTGTDTVERTCNPFRLASMPEPRFGVLLASGAALLFGPLRSLRRRHRAPRTEGGP